MSENLIIPIVIDTNVLVPSLFRSTPLHDAILFGIITPVWNSYILDEAKRITQNMNDEQYSKKIDAASIESVLRILDCIFDPDYEVPNMPRGWPPVSTDRYDDPFLWAAYIGKAEYIISHDARHMLNLGSYKSIQIGKPRGFWDWIAIAHPWAI